MKPKRPKLKQYLLNWLNNNLGWHKKVNLYLIGDEIEFSAESVGRALRKLEEEKQITVEYYDGTYAKGLAKYASLLTEKPKVKRVEIINGKAVLVEV